jgi:chromosome segregation ATPase
MDTQSQIQDHRERQAGADNGIHAQKMHEWDKAKATFEERKAAWEMHDKALPALKTQMANAQSQKLQIDESLQQKRAEEQGSTAKIRTLDQGQRKWIDAYPSPPILEKLLRAIENESKFRETPVGPVGRYVKLLRPEWGSILEKSFGSALNAFVVTSKGDHTILSEMMRRHN